MDDGEEMEGEEKRIEEGEEEEEEEGYSTYGRLMNGSLRPRGEKLAEHYRSRLFFFLAYDRIDPATV